MPVTVYILTTEGPVRIQRIAREQSGVQSVICLDGRAHALPVSSRYDAFVRNPTGVIERATGHGAYRIDVDQAIDDGDSWQLGIYIAHLTESADPGKDIHVFATGEVDRNLDVRPVGHVQQKMTIVRPMISELIAGGADVRVFVPRSDEDIGNIPIEGIEVSAVAHADDVFTGLGLTLPEKPVMPVPVSDHSYGKPAQGTRLIKVGGLLLCVLAAWFSWLPVSWVMMADEGKLHAVETEISDTGNSFVGRYRQGLFAWVQSVRRPDGPAPRLSGSVSVADAPDDCTSGRGLNESDWLAPIPTSSVICSLNIAAELVEPGYVLVGRMAYWPEGLGETGKPERTMRGSGRLSGRSWTLEFDRHPIGASIIRVVMIWGAADPVGPQPWFSTLLSERMESAAFANAQKRVERLGYAVHVTDWQRPGG